MTEEIKKFNFKETFEKAQNGDPQEQLELAEAYAYGYEPLEQNFEEAMKWYKASAQQGNAEAQFELSEMFSNGLGVNRDTTQATFWLKRSAEQGYNPALRKLIPNFPAM